MVRSRSRLHSMAPLPISVTLACGSRPRAVTSSTCAHMHIVKCHAMYGLPLHYTCARVTLKLTQNPKKFCINVAFL